MSHTAAVLNRDQTEISCDEALKIARLDAETAYRDLSGYQITILREGANWHVAYELKDPRLQGGGPHYEIDSQSGEILSKRYDQ